MCGCISSWFSLVLHSSIVKICGPHKDDPDIKVRKILFSLNFISYLNYCHTLACFILDNILGSYNCFLREDIIFPNIFWISFLIFSGSYVSFLHSFICPSFCWSTYSGNFPRLGAGEENFEFSHVSKFHHPTFIKQLKVWLNIEL